VNTVDRLQVIGAILAVAAAFFWFRSAMVPVPDFARVNTFTNEDCSLTPAGVWATDVGTFNKWAASFSAAAAVVVVVSIFFNLGLRPQ
jgi:hypothetical protein